MKAREERALQAQELKLCLELAPGRVGPGGAGALGEDSGPASRELARAHAGNGAGGEAAGGEDARGQAGESCKANAVQKAFEQRRGTRNIVLKARQMGLTTWVAARFFLKTITQPGTLTLEVAHTQEAAEEIFRMVHRFVDWLPDSLRNGPLKTSRANVRQIVFPEIDAQYRVVSAADRNAGRGLTVQNLHCSRAGALAGRRGGDTGGVARGDGAGSGADSGVDAAGGGRMLPRGVAEGR